MRTARGDCLVIRVSISVSGSGSSLFSSRVLARSTEEADSSPPRFFEDVAALPKAANEREEKKEGGDGCGRGGVFGIFKDARVPPKSDSERLSPFLRPSRSVGENLSSHLPPSLSALVSLALAAEVGTEHEPEVPVAAYKECHTIGGIVLFLFFFFSLTEYYLGFRS